MNAADQRWVVIYLSTGFSLAQAARIGEAFNLANRLHAHSADYQLKYVSEAGAVAVVVRREHRGRSARRRARSPRARVLSSSRRPCGRQLGRRIAAPPHRHPPSCALDRRRDGPADARGHAATVGGDRRAAGPGRPPGRHDGRVAGRGSRRVRRGARHVPRRSRRRRRAGDRQQHAAAGRATLCAVDVGLSRAEREPVDPDVGAAGCARRA